MELLNDLTIGKARKALEDGAVSSRDLTQACLKQIRAMDGAIHAFLEVHEDDALKAADDADSRRADGRVLSPLDGIPLAIKDNILIQNKRCTAGSKILSSYIATTDATVTRKLKESGAVLLGKTNMDEFAMGSSTEHSAYGPTLNPHDPDRVPGGSSGGSAAAVASNMCLASLGSDTGGSIRQPASFCGVVGLKPTYGRVSRSGLIAMASSLDQIGPITKSVEDASDIFSVIHGQDEMDQTTAFESDYTPLWRKDLKGVRVGLPRQAWGDGVASGVLERAVAGIEALRSLGAEVKEIDLPSSDDALAVYYVLMPCEVSANMARFDGMRYGMRKQDSALFETYSETRAEGLGAEVRRRILLGTYALSRGYYDAYYVQAKKVQRLIRQGYEAAFQDVDIIVTPTTPTTAFKIGEKISDPLAMYLEDIFTVGVNVAGLPAVSVPCGNYEGLPVGIQFIGKWFKEDDVLGVARVYEEMTK
jgi:aspartyl-tRNA(Asn)/glutamyl-tRNA(Gln) amidotransferase subunit A